MLRPLELRGEAEGRVPVGGQGDGVGKDAVVPPEHSLHKVENALWVPGGEKDREPSDDHCYYGGDVKEEEHHDVRDDQEPLHQWQPPIELTDDIGVGQHVATLEGLENDVIVQHERP
jgi:hypothetical protein